MKRRAYENTDVSPGRSQEAIRKTLRAHGIRQVQFTECWPEGLAVEFIRLERNGGAIEKVIRVRIVGKPDADQLRWRGRGKAPATALERRADTELRRVYRVIFHHLKTKLEAVAEGLVAFEEEFLPHIVLPNGATVYEELKATLPKILAGTQQLALPSLAGIQEKNAR